VGKAAYGADRTCQSPMLDWVVAVRYRPRAMNNRPWSPTEEASRKTRSLSRNVVEMARVELLERCQHLAFVFVP
jgi:hypothetical protein